MLKAPRALCHLLKADPGCTVAIEVIGDVATISTSGAVKAEEDKSSLHGNPVTDRSVDLWKSFSNWVNSVKSGTLDVFSTEFILFRNKSGKVAIAEAFHDASDSDAAQAALEEAKKKLADLDDAHEAWPFYSNAVLNNKKVLLEIIERFHIETGQAAGYENVIKEVTRKHVPESQIEFVIQNLSGWIVKLVAERIASKQDAIITWEEFDKQFKVLFDRARRLELIDFALVSPPGSEEISDHVRVRPKYIRQLELINSDDDEILEAVTDYLRAKINLDKWIEDEIIDESLATDFEARLKSYWSNAKKRINITNKKLTKDERGQLLLLDCKVRSEQLRDMSPPKSTIAGTYHALANVPSIGWHPDWPSLSKDWV